MTADAPTHREWRHARHPVHRSHVTMAIAAAAIRPNMRFVIEMHESRQAVHPDPRDRLPGIPVPPEHHDVRALWQHEAMAAHTPFDRRHPGKRRAARAAVAKVARESIPTDVSAVAEVDWLLRCIRCSRRGPLQSNGAGEKNDHSRRYTQASGHVLSSPRVKARALQRINSVRRTS